jgi:hypothetical protein
VVYIVTGNCLARHLLLEHLFEVVLVLLVPQVEPMLAVEQHVRIQLILEVNSLVELVIPRNSVVEAVGIFT